MTDFQYRPRPSTAAVFKLSTQLAPRRRVAIESQPPRQRQFPPEIDFLAQYGVAPAILLAATAEEDSGATLDRVLLAGGHMSEESYYRLLARHLRAPYYTGALALAKNLDAVRAVDAGIAPLAPNAENIAYVFAPTGAAIRLLLATAARGSAHVRYAITSPQRLGAIVRMRRSAPLLLNASMALELQRPRLAARPGLSGGQLALASVLVFVAPILLLLAPGALEAILWGFFWLVFAVAIGLRLTASLKPLTTARPTPRCDDRDLPIYSILVPMYHEASMATRLIAALRALDYPILGSKL